MWEIKKEQSISIIKVIFKKKEEYMILFLKNIKDESKPIKEH
jgi:hypothetical protein